MIFNSAARSFITKSVLANFRPLTGIMIFNRIELDANEMDSFNFRPLTGIMIFNCIEAW